MDSLNTDTTLIDTISQTGKSDSELDTIVTYGGELVIFTFEPRKSVLVGEATVLFKPPPMND